MTDARPVSARLRTAGAPLAVLAVAAGGLIAVRVRSPFVPGSWGMCPWLVLTGRPCPTCGGLRSVAALSRADLALAWSQHPYLTVTALAAAVLWLAWVWLRLRPGSIGARVRWHSSTLIVVAALGWSIGLVTFGVARWLISPAG